MADHPNAVRLREGYAAFDRGDIAALNDLFSPDVVWHLPGNNQLAGTHRGRDAVFATFAKTAEVSGGTFKVTLHDVIANDEHAVALTRATANHQGRTLDSNDADVYHMKDGKVTEMWSFTGDPAGTDAFIG
jgi:ketosteroid isomerase-like protein